MEKMSWFSLALCLLFATCTLCAPLESEEVFLGDGETTKDFDEPFHGEFNPDLFEGDILLPKKRNGNNNRYQKWTSNQIPYVIDSSVSSRGRQIIQQAVNYYTSNTCIRWVQRQWQSNYVNIGSRQNGCFSMIGMVGRGQTLNLAPACFNSFGTVLHEMMHAIGFWHEQAREDRDRYVTIYWNNIQSNMRSQFDIAKGSLTYGTKYDLGSVMHYPANAFSANGQYTIVPKSGSVSQIGNRQSLSQTDLYKIKQMYGCSGTGTNTGTSSCTDQNVSCAAWAARSECQRNPNYMTIYCRKSCRLC